MCTLTYIPKQQGFIFTHSRDESAQRPASETINHQVNNTGSYYFPQDLKAHGTWMALGETGRAACILNGGSKAYTPKKHYPQSRGILIPRCFDYPTIKAFYQDFDFTEFEPFTLIIRDGEQLFALVHDPEHTDLSELDAREIQIWSSTKLYSKETRNNRRDQFWNWLGDEPELSAQSLMNFHLRGNHKDDNPGFRIKVEGIIETVSLTQIEVSAQSKSIYYQLLNSGASDFKQI